eukprot:503456_1
MGKCLTTQEPSINVDIQQLKEETTRKVSDITDDQKKLLLSSFCRNKIPHDLVAIVAKYYDYDYVYHYDTWANKYAHQSFVIKNDVIECKDGSESNLSAFLVNVVSSGINEWMFKIKKYNHVGQFLFGIWFYDVKITNDYLNSCIGTYENTSYVFNTYETLLLEGDTVSMIVDFNSLSFDILINDVRIDRIDSQPIKQTTYRAAISMVSGVGNEIELISYNHTN